MQFVQTHTIKAIGDEIRRGAFNSRPTAEEVGGRAGPVDKIRQVTEHTMTSFNEMVACEGGSAQVAPSDKLAA